MEHRLARLTAVVLVLTCLGGRAAALPTSSQADQRYRIHARLDAKAHVVDGELELSFVNHASRALPDLLLHLYLNAFAADSTVFMREGGARLRGGTLERKGAMEVFELRTRDGQDLLAHASTDLIEGDRTQMRVPLAVPLAPGARMHLVARFRATLPSVVARSGFAGDFHMVAQWFPKLARLSPEGRWVGFPYHGLGEFYADFADYELSIDVPAEHVVAAPGVLVGSRRVGDRRTEDYRVERVHDVAWASQPRLSRVRDASAAPVLEVFAGPGELPGARRQLKRLRGQVSRLSRWLGRLPWKRLVLVLPPRGARGAAGMEYPGLMVGWDVPLGHWPFFPVPLIRETVTAHELAHQWFSGLVANDELHHPVLDEGLAEYVSNDLERSRLSRRSKEARALGLPLDGFELMRLRAGSTALPSSLLPATAYQTRSQLTRAIYLRPALALETLRRTWGPRRLDAALADYARTNRFGHPTPKDLFEAFDHNYWPGFAHGVLEPALGGSFQDLRIDHYALRREGDAHVLEAALSRSSSLALPSGVRVVHADGTARTYPWPAASPRLSVTDRSRAAAVSVEADPHGQNLLDPDRRNNTLALVGDAGRALRWRLLGWVQMFLRGIGP